MTRIILKTILVILLISCSFQCKRSNEDYSQYILTGKLVIDGGCRMTGAVEILDGKFDPSKVTASWTDPDNDSVYHNVFRLGGVRDACNLSYYGVSKGDTFRFQMDPHPQNLICYTCMIELSDTAAMPPVPDAVKNVKKL
jgi:hypothetical protein